MDKNTIIGLLLIAGILFTFTLVTEPEPVNEETSTETLVKDGLDYDATLADSADVVFNDVATLINTDSVPETIKQNPAMLKEYMDSLEMVEKIKLELSQSAAQQENFGIFTPGVVGENQYSTLENDKIIVRFSNKGGRIVDVKLK
ncbi:hypothetical protein OAN33_04695, partial [Flavobacteriales bacterium]|nr:hypothetical protein [Flavobacteriales bacterium]